MRNFDYLKNYNNMYEVKQVLLKLQDTISKKVINGDINNSADYSKYLIYITNTLKELSEKDFTGIILNDILSDENIDFQVENGYMKKDTSKIGLELEEKINTAFQIEEAVRIDIAKIWSEKISDFNNFKNGDDFNFVVHSGYSNKVIALDNHAQYKNNQFNNTSFISCSYITNKHMGLYNNNIGLAFSVNTDNFLGANDKDAATISQRNQTVSSIKKIGDSFVAINSKGSSLMLPDEIIEKNIEENINQNGEMLNSNNGTIYNEIVLDKTASKPVGIVIITNGIDPVIEEYLTALKMSKDYNLAIKVINKSVYRRKENLSSFTTSDIKNFNLDLSSYKDLINEYDADVFIENYKRDVLLNGLFDEQIANQILNQLEALKEKVI